MAHSEFADLMEAPPRPPPKEGAVASGVRILFNFSRCEGPITEKEGLVAAVKLACKKSSVRMMGGPRFRRFSDGTMNASGDLAESHFGLGTYLAARHVAGEVNMCHETCDNTALAKHFVECLRAEFRPLKVKIVELRWESE